MVLRLKLELAMVQNKTSFAAELLQDVASAVSIPVSRLRLVSLIAGSIIAEVRAVCLPWHC